MLLSSTLGREEEQIELGNYTIPPVIDTDVMQAFTTTDFASINADALLKDVLRNPDPENCDTSYESAER